MNTPLRQWRERANLSQTALAEAVSRNKSHISNIEAGRSGMSPALMSNIAKTLAGKIDGVSFTDVLVGIAPPPTPGAPLQAPVQDSCIEVEAA